MPALFIVLGLAVVVFIAAAGHQKHPGHHETPAPAGLVVELDRGMPPSVVAQVLTALGQENDPARLDALGTSLAAYYPLAASELHAKAMTLRAGSAASAPAALPAAIAPALPAHDQTASQESPPAGSPPARQLDAAAVLQAAMRALVEETDPVVLDGFADSIRDAYSTAAEILSTRAQTLRASTASGAEESHPPSAASETASDAPSSTLSPEAQS
jgi:hypothetical protein